MEAPLDVPKFREKLRKMAPGITTLSEDATFFPRAGASIAVAALDDNVVRELVAGQGQLAVDA
jgi:hypothetical protein